MNHDPIDRMVAGLRPEVDASHRLDPAAPAARELRSLIPTRNQETTMSMSPRRKRLLVAAPIAAALAVGGVAATALFDPFADEGSSLPLGPEPAAAAVLDVSVEEGVVVAEVLDPTADAEAYAAEFAEHGLDVTLRFVPASPTVVGNLVYLDDNMTGEGTDERDVEVVTSPGECTPQGGGCPVGVRIPEDYDNPVEVVFGREPEAGEHYESTNAATAPGEALEGMEPAGMTVGELRDALAGVDQEIAGFRKPVQEPCGGSENDTDDLDADGEPASTDTDAENGSAAGEGSRPAPGPNDPPQAPEDGLCGEMRELTGDEVGDDMVVADVSLHAPGEVSVIVEGETGLF
ncbi:hypothetical protein HNR06_003973 [Nocardiopsis arvandica]|uniref:Uncharacterized protein n=1 Tax=Nocardiopsis sinuspersici TaxID=501010 RepID=A0A7Y9XEJ3_9ACTN|nr:hypothetical protein [Nocardiopsis sinuspersici]NYH54384.1 hypothetical protein [Nocardiopsis sinuspersici]